MVITFIIGTALPELTAAKLFEHRQLTLVIVPTFRTVLRLIAHDAGNLHTMQTLTVSPIGEVGILHRIPTILPTPTTANLAVTHLLVGTVMPGMLLHLESFITRLHMMSTFLVSRAGVEHPSPTKSSEKWRTSHLAVQRFSPPIPLECIDATS